MATLHKRKLVLYIAASLDGYIAKPGDDLSFLDLVQMEGEDYGYNEFMASVDTVIIGRKTFDWVVNVVGEYPNASKETYVITRTAKAKLGNVNFYSGDIKDLILNLKSQPGKIIFCDGGAEIVNLLLKEKLFDELIISVIPVLLGNGIRLFKDDRPEQNLDLISSKPYNSGLIQLHYQIISENKKGPR